MVRRLAGLALTSVSLFTMTAPALAAEPGFCRDYARSAVHEFEVAAHTPGCLREPNARWDADFRHHFEWCLTVARGQAWAERDIRRHRLHECQARIDY